MHSFPIPHLQFSLIAGFLITGLGLAQEPSQKEEPKKNISVEQIIERIMSYDKNKDGLITMDELPERMQNLINQGDLNKDGSLDAQEVRKLAMKFSITPNRIQGNEGGRGEPVLGELGRALNNLKLSGDKKNQAREVIKDYQETVRKMTEQAQADLLKKMKAILSDEEFKDFKASVERSRGERNQERRETPIGDGEKQREKSPN